MKFLFNLSFRYKIPLWGGLLIVVTSLAVSLALIAQAYDDLQVDVLNSSANLSRILAKTLFPAMLQEEVWRSFEIIRAPLHGKATDNPIQPEMILVLDQEQNVYVSSNPVLVPMLAKLPQLGEDFSRLSQLIASRPETDAPITDYSSTQRIYIATPIAEEGMRLGTLVLIHSNDVFLPRFRNVAWRSAFSGLLILAVLLPLNWYWGLRMAAPLIELAKGVRDVSHGEIEYPHAVTYPYRDELGQLFETYGLMLKALQEKRLLEQEMVRSERLAAIGRLSAGIAHEINNPLGGMLVALDNFKRRGGHDERSLKTMAMIERGLTQIRDTVSAILVEARVKGRNLAAQDLEDVQMLLTGEAHKRSVMMEIDNALVAPVSLPATLMRQVLMNLLLNAIHASEPAGKVRCAMRFADNQLMIEVENAGRTIPVEVMTHLFEPFVSGDETGHGLGLWVTYQIVSQLGGQITAKSGDGLTRFEVFLPVGVAT